MEIKEVETDLLGTKRAIAKAEQANEVSAALRDRLAKELSGVEDQVAKIVAERDVLAERYQMLQRSKAQTEEELKNADAIKEELDKKVTQKRDPSAGGFSFVLPTF